MQQCIENFSSLTWVTKSYHYYDSTSLLEPFYIKIGYSANSDDSLCSIPYFRRQLYSKVLNKTDFLIVEQTRLVFRLPR